MGFAFWQSSHFLYYLMPKFSRFMDFVSTWVSDWPHTTCALKGQRTARYNPFVITAAHAPFSAPWCAPLSRHPADPSWFLNTGHKHKAPKDTKNQGGHSLDSHAVIKNTRGTKIASFRGIENATWPPAPAPAMRRWKKQQGKSSKNTSKSQPQPASKVVAKQRAK